MKKLLLAGAVALFGLSNAQMQKGSWVIGASSTVGFNNHNSTSKFNGTSVEGPSVSTIAVTPSAGYFVANNIAVGLDLSLASVTSKQDTNISGVTVNVKNTMTTFSVMPTGTYYFYNEGKVIPYLGAGIGYASLSEKTTYKAAGVSNTTDDSYSGFAWKVKGGATYLVTNSIGLDLGLTYGQQYFNEEVPGTNSKINTTLKDFGVSLGFSIFLKGKSKNSDNK